MVPLSQLAKATRVAAGDDAALGREFRYDSFAIALHWLTALLVVALFALAQIWGLVPRAAIRSLLQHLHVSLGVVLAATVAVRIVWRGALGRRMPSAATGIVEQAARGAHYLLYALLIGMVLAGLGKRWARGRGVEFFGLLQIPSPAALDPAWRPALDAFHHWGAWAIIVLSGLHATAALVHHYGLHDDVLRRMLPGRRRIGAH